ncbi:unnamed protein product [Rotaria magnacalcarata]|uniref:Uncharacterized protein n=1 Tax=Rotaria magnacalcarata TaxID=392030 RepID=A0A816NEI1_9BILA|nr:unnamed protein product [Rotaria magnacalcarata]CAF2190330.1 unnamed protein product [Rotaria magnacalcarata]CAF3724619.1 unnamed protein product [Rotaria magnacalcarata]CAF3789803.1 unnamed protein product [Rotaria magnacalcarata]
MDAFKRGHFKFRSLPRCLSSAIRSISFERLDNRPLSNTPSLPRRRNGISADSYNEIRKLILQAPLPTTVLRRSPTKEFSLDDIGIPLAASSYYILTLINECSTLVMFNKDHELCRIDLSNLLVLVHDLCWSPKLNMFLMAGYSLYTFNPRSCILSTIERIELARGEWIVSITIDSISMYLLYSSRSARIECRSLFLPHILEKQWLQKDFLRQTDFLAQCIRINQWNILAMTIKQKDGGWRVDLYDSNNLYRIHRGCSLGQGVPGMRNCLVMPYNRLWIVINNCSMPEQVILLDENGRMKVTTHLDKPRGCFNLCLVGDEWIAMNVKDKLRLYKVQS